VTEPPDRLARISRKNPDQSRLFDTQEIQTISDQEPPPDEPGSTPNLR
jgi:hypothetical protein